MTTVPMSPRRRSTGSPLSKCVARVSSSKATVRAPDEVRRGHHRPRNARQHSSPGASHCRSVQGTALREAPMPRYTVLLYKEDGVYAALVPMLGVASQGRTVEEALAMAHEATALQVKWLAEHNEPILEEEEPPIVAAVNVDIPVVAPAT